MRTPERRAPTRAIAAVATATGSPSRINVAVNEPMLDAIDRVIDADDVTLTEAVRRLLGYGELVHAVRHTPGCTLIVRDARGRERAVVAR